MTLFYLCNQDIGTYGFINGSLTPCSYQKIQAAQGEALSGLFGEVLRGRT